MIKFFGKFKTKDNLFKLQLNREQTAILIKYSLNTKIVKNKATIKTKLLRNNTKTAKSKNLIKFKNMLNIHQDFKKQKKRLN